LAFCFLFHLSKLVQKLWNFLWWFIGRVRDFTSVFWKILKVLFKKISICEIFFFFSKFCGLLFSFFLLLFLTFYFSISSICTCQKILEIFIFFILWIRDFIKEFWKIMEYFSKKYRHLNPKFFINSIVYYLFFFILWSFW